MLKILSLLLLMLFVGCDRPPRHDPPPPEKRPREVPLILLEDLRFLQKTIETVHPSPFTISSQKAFREFLSRAGEGLRGDEDPLDLWRLWAPVVASLGDAHTNLVPPTALLRQKLRKHPVTFLPFSPLLYKGRIFVHTSADRDLRKKDEILSINGESAADLMKRLLAPISHERRAYAESKLENNLPGFYYMITGNSGPFRIRLARDAARLEVRVAGVSHTLGGPRIARGARSPFVLDVQGRIARIEINAFADHRAFTAFLKKAFQEIAGKGVRVLLIDLRENTGGNSQLGDLLIQRCFTGTFVQNLEVSIRVSPKTRMLYKTVPGFSGAKDGTLFGVYTYRGPFKTLRPRPPFTAVHLITGPATFSSGVMFAAAFANFSTGSIFGEETGGNANHYGDMLRFSLPKSGLVLTVSHKRFVTRRGARGGVKPTIPVVPTLEQRFGEGDPQLDAILSRLKEPAP